MKSKKSFRSYLLSHSEKKSLAGVAERVIEKQLDSYPSCINYQLSFCDDLTWSIWQNKALFTRIAPCNYYLTDAVGQSLEEQTAPGARFVWDFPAGEFKQTLSNLLKGRSFRDYMVLSVRKMVWQAESQSDASGVKVLLIDTALTSQSLNLESCEPVSFLVLYADGLQHDSVKKTAKKIIEVLGLDNVTCTEKEFNEYELLSLYGAKDYLRNFSSKYLYFSMDEKNNNLVEILEFRLKNIEKAIELLDREKSVECVQQLLVGFYDVKDLFELYCDDLNVDVVFSRRLHDFVSSNISNLENLKKLNLVLVCLNSNDEMFLKIKQSELNLVIEIINVEYDRCFSGYFHKDYVEKNINDLRRFADDVLGLFECTRNIKEKEVLKNSRLAFKYHCSKLLGLDGALNKNANISVLNEFKIHCDKAALVLSIFSDVFPKHKAKNILMSVRSASDVLAEFFDLRDFELVLERVLGGLDKSLDESPDGSPDESPDENEILLQTGRRVLNAVKSSRKKKKLKARSEIQEVVSESFASDVNELEYSLMRKMAKEQKKQSKLASNSC